MKSYVNNLETGHIELHFEKSEYMSLSADQKAELKRFFSWSRYATAWVSKGTKDHYWALKIAAELGFTEEEKQGERLSYAEELERKAEKAEHRAERMEEHAANAEHRAEGLQSEFNKYRKDWSWLTQPIISGHAGSQRFGRQRQRIMDRYDKGFEEYRKSEYFKNRAETARATASMAQLENPVYIDNRIRECQKNIRDFEKRVAQNEDALYRVENGEGLKNYSGEIITAEKIQARLAELAEKLEYEIDKQAFLENAMDAIRASGRNVFKTDDVQVGYIVKMRRWGRCEIVAVGPKNVTFKILDGGAAGGCLTESYAAIAEIIAVKEAEKVVNPFTEGDILCHYSICGNHIIKAFQVIKTTATGVKLQQIAVENNKPIADRFISDKAMQRKVVKSKWSDYIGVYEGDWQLHKYTA